jgi:hypothetical protein
MSISRLRRATAIVSLAAVLGGCETYLARRDTITAGLGDTVRTNIVAQVDDMQPRGAASPNLAFSAERLARRSASAAAPAADPLLAGSSPGLTDGVQQIARSALGRAGLVR